MTALRRVLAALALALLLARPAAAFYEYDKEDAHLEARGLLRLYADARRNPDLPLLYPVRDDATLAPEARIIASGRYGPHLAIDVNLHFFGGLFGSDTAHAPDVERSSAMEWTLSERERAKAHLALDHLYLTLTAGRFDLRAGRQPINLATCFYFTPNDLFAPFAAQTFYRTYKPGVDGARLDVRLGALSQLSLYHVYGYALDAAGANFYSGRPESRATTLARASVTLANFEWAVLGGKAKDDTIIGASLQGEFFKWLGLRAEGHRRDAAGFSYLSAAAGLEHRFPSSLTVRYEHFHNGAGAATPEGYQLASVGYPGREYGALGFSYEFTPLFTGQLLALANWNDNSRMLVLYGVYSLADESEIAFGLTLPRGEQSSFAAVKSEYGLYPLSAYLDWRLYY